MGLECLKECHRTAFRPQGKKDMLKSYVVLKGEKEGNWSLGNPGNLFPPFLLGVGP